MVRRLIKGHLEVRHPTVTVESLIDREATKVAAAAEKDRAKATEEALFVEKEHSEATLNSIGDATPTPALGK